MGVLYSYFWKGPKMLFLALVKFHSEALTAENLSDGSSKLHQDRRCFPWRLSPCDLKSASSLWAEITSCFVFANMSSPRSQGDHYFRLLSTTDRSHYAVAMIQIISTATMLLNQAALNLEKKKKNVKRMMN